MNPKKCSIHTFALLLCSYAFVAFISVLPVEGVSMLQRMPSVVCFFFAVYLLLYFRTRMIDRRVRKYLVTVGALIVFWSLLRAAKYIAFEENGGIARFIWYLYYIPMLLIPQVSFEAALAVGEPEDKPLPKIRRLTGLVTLLGILPVLTNDLHQLVFAFKPGFENWDADYSHEPLYWIITVWNYMSYFMTLAVMFRKCRLSTSRKLIWIPMTYVGLGIFGLILLIIDGLPKLWGSNFGGFPEIACFMFGGFWMLCIAIGLVPSNKGYGRLIQETSMAVRIADLDNEIAFQSRSALPMTKEQLAAPSPVLLDENTLVVSAKQNGLKVEEYLTVLLRADEPIFPY